MNKDSFLCLHDRISDAYFRLHKDGRIVCANANSVSIFRKSPKDVHEQDLWTHCPDLKDTHFYKACMRMVSEKCSEMCLQECLPPYDKWYEIRIFFVEDGLDIYLTDITNRILAEKVLVECERNRNLILANLPGIAYRRSPDDDCMMQFVSEGCIQLTGYAPESLLYGRKISFIDMIAPDCRSEYVKKWAAAIEDKRMFDEHYRIIRANGEQIWVRERGQAVYNSKNEIEAIEGLIFDVDEQVKYKARAEYLVTHDSLSGIYNRQHFMKEARRFDCEQYMPLSIVFVDINGLKLINNAIGHEQGDQIILQSARIIESLSREKDVPCRLGGGQFCVLMPQSDGIFAEMFISQILAACEDYNCSIDNEMMRVNLSMGHATKDMSDISVESVIQLAEENMYKRKLLERKSMHSSLLASIQSTMLARSQETEEHAERLIKLTRILGMKLNLAQIELNELELLAALHDIGKVGVNDQILNKPARLTDEEWVEMKKHSEIGYRIAMSTPELMPIADYILAHHERWDGQGYPQRLSGEKIPFVSRVLSVVDAYDAMTQDRSYRKALPKSFAIEEIKTNAGKQFDPEVAQAFLELINDIEDVQTI